MYPVPCPGGGGYLFPSLGGGGTHPQVQGGTLSQVQGAPHTRSEGGWGTPSQVVGGGYPIPGLGRGYPIPGHGGGYPIPSLGRGVPHPRSRGTYPIPGWGEGVPHQDLGWGTPPARPGMGYPPRPEMGSPPASVDRHTDWCQNITFPRTTYAGGNKVIQLTEEISLLAQSFPVRLFCLRFDLPLPRPLVNDPECCNLSHNQRAHPEPQNTCLLVISANLRKKA